MHRRAVRLAVWGALVLVAALVAARARYTADLSAFLPRAPTAAQQFLVEQLRDGPVSRLILVDIEGADAPSRAALSRALAARLRSDPAFGRIANGEPVGLERDRAFVLEHRYLLSEAVSGARFTAAGLAAAIGAGVEQLASPLGLLAGDLFARDPTGETLGVLEQLEPAGGGPRLDDGVYASRDGRRALLIAETRAAGSDSEGQARAQATLRAAFAAAQAAVPAAAPAVVRLTGPGVFAAEARARIEHEAVRLSLASSALIATLLLLVYRSLPALLYGLLPVVSGALAGVAAVALGYGLVHGVTLGFGVTLIGEAVDYSVYLFLQTHPGGSARAARGAWTVTLWPTIRLGMLTSVCGFASLLPSAFPGLAQLGLYSIAGLVAAALVTRFVLPELLPAGFRLGAAAPLGRSLARLRRALVAARGLLVAVPLLAALALYAHRDRLWSHELAALSPVTAAEQALDGELRAELGAPDVRTLIVLDGADEQAVLEACEAVRGALDGLVAAATLAGYQLPCRYLPSRAAQRARQAALPPPAQLAARLALALDGLPVRAERLAPFLADVEAARRAPLVTRADLAGTALAAGADALLVPGAGRWHALVPLEAPGTAPIAVEAVRRAIDAAAPPTVQATVLDLKREADALYAGYLAEALRLSLAGFVAILLLLSLTLRSARRVARVLAPLVLAVLAVVCGLALAGVELSILHLIGLLLVIAIGSNYALFFDREAEAADPEAAARMLASLAVANLTTVLAFGALATSTVPVLAALGTTVAPGALLALLFAAALAGAPAADARRG